MREKMEKRRKGEAGGEKRALEEDKQKEGEDEE